MGLVSSLLPPYISLLTGIARTLVEIALALSTFERVQAMQNIVLPIPGNSIYSICQISR